MSGIARPVQGKGFAVYQIDGCDFQGNGLDIHHICHILHGIISQKYLSAYFIITLVFPDLHNPGLALVCLFKAVFQGAASGPVKRGIHLARIHVNLNHNGCVQEIPVIRKIFQQFFHQLLRV